MAYCLSCIWGYNEFKGNVFAFFRGDYEKSTKYNIENLWENGNIENAAMLETGSLYTEDANMVIRLNSAYPVRSVELKVVDFINPKGTEATAITTHVYYRDLQDQLKAKRMLLRVGDFVVNLPENKEGEYIIVPSNVEKSSILLENIYLHNYRSGYMNFFWGGCALGICIGFFWLFGAISISDSKVKSISDPKEKVVIRTIIRYTAIGVMFLLVAIYVLCYFLLPHIIHPEAYGDFNSYANNNLGLLIPNFIPKIFDNTMIEQGLYRPRVLAFAWQYLDTNLMIMINRIFPWFGIKMPLALTTIPFSLIIWRYVYIKCFPNVSGIWGALFGVIILFLPNIQTATYFFLRSAKIVTPFVMIGLMNYALFHFNEPLQLKMRGDQWIRILIAAFVIFALCTLDEQVIAACFFVLALSLFNTIINKKTERMFLVFFMALLLYFVYFKTWGRWLFEYFTPGILKEHFHNISMVIKDFDISFILQGLEVYGKILNATFQGQIGIGIVIGVLLIFWVYIDDIKQKIISLAIIGFSFALVIALLIGLPILYYYDDMILSIYFISPILIFLYAFVYVVSKSKLIALLFSKKVLAAKYVAYIALSAILLLNISKIEESHLRHLGINGGSVQFRRELFDLKYFNDYYDSVIVTRQQYLDYMEEKK